MGTRPPGQNPLSASERPISPGGRGDSDVACARDRTTLSCFDRAPSRLFNKGDLHPNNTNWRVDVGTVLLLLR